MVDYLRGTTDEVTKTDVVKRIGELAERFAPDTQWFLDTMNQVCSRCNLKIFLRSNTVTGVCHQSQQSCHVSYTFLYHFTTFA